MPTTSSNASSDTRSTKLGQVVRAWTDAHPGQTGVCLMPRGMDALGARLRLAQMAERSIDLQYFLMKKDRSSLVFTKALLEAADRGVIVRFLIDDIFTTTSDRHLLLLDHHPNVEVRLFNPIGSRGIRVLNFLGKFERANRRMHNKSFTVDNQIVITGGRNIADEYFELKPGEAFEDLDVLAVGPVATAVTESFDDFWNHELAVPMARFGTVRDEEYRQAREGADAELKRNYDEVFLKAMNSEFMQTLVDGSLALLPASVEFMSDRVDKLTNPISAEHMQLSRQLRYVLDKAESDVVLVSPYFIPGDEGVTLLAEQVKRGTSVTVVTNSLASTNHVSVHGAYSRYRRALLKAGVKLYEVRADAGRELKRVETGPTGVTLHTKALLFDQDKVFVGSLNLDPRAIEINSEMGLLITSRDMIEKIYRDHYDALAASTYELRLDANGKIRWHGLIDGAIMVEDSEPQSSIWRRLYARLSRIVPESQL